MSIMIKLKPAELCEVTKLTYSVNQVLNIS